MNSPETLITGYLNDTLTEAECAQLQQWLKADSAHLREFTDAVLFDQEIRAAVTTRATQGGTEAFAPAVLPAAPARGRWFAWRPLAAAAAGLALGISCVSVAWAFAAPRAMTTASRLAALVDGGFEQRAGRLASGFPVEFGVWSGDESEVGPALAKEGKQSLRFNRAEGDPAVPSFPATSCDVYQIVDLRSLQAEAAGGEATLEVAVQFLDSRPAPGAEITFTCRTYVFSGSPASLRDEWPLTRKEALAAGSSQVQSAGGAPQAWRSVTVKVLLPAQADFAVVQLVAGKARTGGNEAIVFGEQFADDVRLTLKTQPRLPVRITQR